MNTDKHLVATWISGKRLARVAFETNANLTLGEIQDIIIIAKGGKIIKTEIIEISDANNYMNIDEFIKPSHFNDKSISKKQINYIKTTWKNLSEYELKCLDSITVLVD